MIFNVLYVLIYCCSCMYVLTSITSTKKNLPGTLSGCQTVWIQIWVRTVLQRLANVSPEITCRSLCFNSKNLYFQFLFCSRAVAPDCNEIHHNSFTSKLEPIYACHEQGSVNNTKEHRNKENGEVSVIHCAVHVL